MEEKCECKGCGGKVFLTIVITVVAMALVMGGLVWWWNSANGTTSSSTSGSTASTTKTVTLDPNKGTWSESGGYRVYTNTSIEGSKIVMKISETQTKGVNEADWKKFIQSLKVIQGTENNNLILVTPDYTADGTKGMILLGINGYSISQWRNLHENATAGIIYDINEDNILLTVNVPADLDNGEVISEYSGLKNEIVDVFGNYQVDIYFEVLTSSSSTSSTTGTTSATTSATSATSTTSAASSTSTTSPAAED